MLDWLASGTILAPELWRSLLVALFGAGAGAWAAQSLAAKIREREERLRTVRAANAAAMLAYTIVDSMLGFKHQLVKPMVDTYTIERTRLRAERASASTRPPGAWPGPVTIHAPADMRTFAAMLTPIKELQEFVFKQVSPPIRPFWVMGVLAGTLAALEQLTTERNNLIGEFRDASRNGKDVIESYFGLETPTGADQRYPHLVDAISEKTDDAIYFAKLVGDDLRTYTTALRATLPANTQPFAPIVTSADFSRRADIMPSAEHYADYNRMRQDVYPCGTGKWNARFEALSIAQYQTASMHYVM